MVIHMNNGIRSAATPNKIKLFRLRNFYVGTRSESKNNFTDCCDFLFLRQSIILSVIFYIDLFKYLFVGS